MVQLHYTKFWQNKKVGYPLLRILKFLESNFLIQNRALSFTPRGAWRILAESTFGALRAPAEARSAEATSSQNWDLDKMRYLLVKIRTYFDEHPDEE